MLAVAVQVYTVSDITMRTLGGGGGWGGRGSTEHIAPPPPPAMHCKLFNIDCSHSCPFVTAHSQFVKCLEKNYSEIPVPKITMYGHLQNYSPVSPSPTTLVVQLCAHELTSLTEISAMHPWKKSSGRSSNEIVCMLGRSMPPNHIVS